MRYSYLTPHQYTSLAPYVDTVLVSTFSPFPLDIAVPHATSNWIASDLTRRTSERFVGRVAVFALGALFLRCGLTEDLVGQLDNLTGSQTQFGVLITDRTLTRDSWSLASPQGVQWIAIDWWQWLHQRVPAHRWNDAWMYLAHAHAGYLGSAEQRQIGLPEATAKEMAEQGGVLLQQLTDWVSEEIRVLWGTTSTPTAFE